MQSGEKVSRFEPIRSSGPCGTSSLTPLAAAVSVITTAASHAPGGDVVGQVDRVLDDLDQHRSASSLSASFAGDHLPVAGGGGPGSSWR